MQFFTEQGSSVSQMAAAKIMDVSARLPGCDGQAADAVSALDSKIGGCSQIADVWIRLPRHRWSKKLNHVLLLEQHKKSTGMGKNLTRERWRGPATWKDMLKNASSDTVNWQTRKVEQRTQFQALVWMIINSSRRNSNQLEKCQKFAHKLVFTCLYLARIGQPDTLWSVNKLARSVTKRAQACDRRLARLISYIHHTSDFRQCFHVETRQDSTINGVLCIFGSRTFVPVSWMCRLLSRAVLQRLK